MANDTVSTHKPTIHKSLLELVFSGAYLLRWNDKLRPRDLMEIDKQAHKMLVACVLWEHNSRGMPLDERMRLGEAIVEGGIFDYFFRMVVTDIKPPLYYKIKENRQQFAQLTHHVFRVLEPKLSPLGDFWERFKRWHTEEPGPEEPLLARPILNAAHMFASSWEFHLIKPFNEHFDQEMPAIEKDFATKLDKFASEVSGMDKVRRTGNAVGNFVNFCGQLRFQVRWTQAPRIPQTDVLGHMFIVACYAYFFSLSVSACRARRVNNFFSGLFHDLPELLTRDIISPVKKSSKELEELIKECEEQELMEKIYRPLTDAGEQRLVDLLRYYLGERGRSEFDECFIDEDGQVLRAADRYEAQKRGKEGDFPSLFTWFSQNYNDDRCQPKDGRLIKACDSLAAFMETHSSIRAGVSNGHLYDARTKLREGLCDGRMPEELRLSSILADFD